MDEEEEEEEEVLDDLIPATTGGSQIKLSAGGGMDKGQEYLFALVEAWEQVIMFFLPHLAVHIVAGLNI